MIGSRTTSLVAAANNVLRPDGCIGRRVAVGMLRAKRRRDVLERLSLGIHRVAPGDGGGNKHQRSAYCVANEDVAAAARRDEHAEERGCREATDACAHRVED